MFLCRHVQQRFHFFAIGNVPLEHALVVGVHNAYRPLHLPGIPFDFQVAVLQVRSHVQRGFEVFQVFVKGAEELVDSSGNSDGLLHYVAWRLQGSFNKRSAPACGWSSQP